MKRIVYYSNPRPGTDPARGPFAVPERRGPERPNRPGKTREDRLPVDLRPRVQAEQKRRAIRARIDADRASLRRAA